MLILNYIKRNYRQAIVFIVFSFVVVLLGSMLVVPQIESGLVALSSYENLGYTEVGVALSCQSESDTFIQNSSIYTAVSEEAMEELDLIYSLTVMEIEGVTYTQTPNLLDESFSVTTYVTLASDEVAISEQIAERYGLKVGDCLYTRYLSQIRCITVKYIFAQTFGCLSYDQYDYGMIVLGYDEALVSDDQLYISYNSQASIIYREVVLIHEIVEDVQTSLVNGVLLLFLIMLIAIVGVEILSQSIGRGRQGNRFSSEQASALQDYRMIMQEGRGRLMLLCLIFVEKLLKYIVPIGLAVVVYVLFLSTFYTVLTQVSILAIIIFDIYIVGMTIVYWLLAQRR